MANPTTNYGFVLPTPTDLVTDLPADFEVALQGVDTRLKALQPGTTLGDLAYSSATANTNTRLGIGSSGQVLTVSAGVPSWATPTSGAYTLISTTAITATASITLSSIPSTYTDLVLLVDGAFENSGGSQSIQVNSLTGGYSYNWNQASNATNNQSTSAGSWQIMASMRYPSGGGSGGFFATFPSYASTANTKQFSANGAGGNGATFSYGAVYGCSTINSIKITWAGTPTAQGNVYLYGVK